MRCSQELCPNWGGDGRVCVCALMGIEFEKCSRCKKDISPGEEVRPILGVGEGDTLHEPCLEEMIEEWLAEKYS